MLSVLPPIPSVTLVRENSVRMSAEGRLCAREPLSDSCKVQGSFEGSLDSCHYSASVFLIG